MAWNHDLGVIEYLENRLRYYKKLATSSKNIIQIEVDKDNKIKFVVAKKWRGRLTVRQIRSASDHYQKRVDEFQSAIEFIKKFKPQ